MNLNKHSDLLLINNYSLFYYSMISFNNADDGYSIYRLIVCNTTIVRFTFTGIT